MSEPNDGGPAFPQTFFAAGGACPTGMSLRAWLAGQCTPSWEMTQGFFGAVHKSAPSVDEILTVRAQLRVAEADAIIAELEVKP